MKTLHPKPTDDGSAAGSQVAANTESVSRMRAGFNYSYRHAVSQRKEDNFMTWKEDNATTLSLLFPIQKEMMGELGSQGSFSPNDHKPAGFSRRRKTFSSSRPGVEGSAGVGCVERTMKGKEPEKDSKTRRKIGKGIPLSNSLKRGLNFRSK